MNKILFSKTRDVKSPTRAHDTDAGIDFFLPNKFTEEDIAKSNATTGDYLGLSEGKIRIRPQTSLLISAGVKVIVPKGWALIFFNKSGIASKKHLTVGACVIDCGYFGEVHINLINTSDHDIEVSEGEKIVQGILLPVGDHQPEEVDDIMKHTENSARGEGGFGSSGNF